jgi:hypothetical protein
MFGPCQRFFFVLLGKILAVAADNVDFDILAENWSTTGERNAHYYYHYDGLGSVVALTDSAGTTAEQYTYDVYGAAIIRNTHDEIRNTSSVGNPYFFTARRFDTETNLYYYRARYYHREEIFTLFFDRDKNVLKSL